ncbi:MAG: phosphotransferase [Chloroflexi bacterium]|nr:phosphotransferase [Chloroflexota bacterium]
MLSNRFAAAPFALLRPDYFYRQLHLGRGRAPIKAEPLRAILSLYELTLLEPAQALSNQGRNDSLILHTHAGKKILKRYKPGMDAEAVEHEHSILSYLAQVNFPAPRLWPTAEGPTFVQPDAHCYAIFDWLEGTFQYHHYFLLPKQTLGFIAAAGEALSRLHQALETFEPAGRNLNGFQSLSGQRWRDFDWCFNQLQKFQQTWSTLPTSHRQQLGAFLLKHGDWLENRLLELSHILQNSPLSRVIIHGDYGPYNLLFNQNAPAVIIDFELARLDWRLSDLAKALPMFARNRFGFNLRKAEAFLNGYWAASPHASTEMAFLHPVWEFLLLRRIIACCDRYYQTGATRWLQEAQFKLTDAHWLIQSPQMRVIQNFAG